MSNSWTGQVPSLAHGADAHGLGTFDWEKVPP